MLFEDDNVSIIYLGEENARALCTPHPNTTPLYKLFTEKE